MFDKGVFSGLGKFEHNDGSIYEGEWQDCQQHGKGKMTYPESDSVFEGMFEKGKKNGLGVMIKKNVSKIKGMWKDDELVNMIMFENLQVMEEFKDQGS